MKRLLLIIAALFILSSCVVHTSATVRYPRETYPRERHYDHHGHYQGYSQRDHHGVIRHYDNHGRYLGRSHRR